MMVYGVYNTVYIYITIVNRVYIPAYNWEAPHCGGYLWIFDNVCLVFLFTTLCLNVFV